MLNEIKNNTLIICPDSYKKKLLASFYNEKKIVSASFLSLEEYKKNYYFDYDYRAIKYLCDKYSLSVNNAKEIIENIYYVTDREYGIEKLDKLVKYKKELIQNNLLVFNKLFNKYLSNKNIVIVGYGQLNKFDRALFKDEQIIKYEYIDKEYSIYEFSDIEKEVEYVYNAISDLLNSGVDINKIYLLNAADEYSNYIKRFNSYYDFKIEDKKSNCLYATLLGQEFLSNIKKLDRTELYNSLIESNNEYSNKLINIIIKYVDVDLKDVYDFIVEDLKNIKIDNPLSDVVKCQEFNYQFNDDEYVFMMGFNDNVPSVKKDNSYITDNLRDLVNESSIEEENLLIKENTINYLSNIKNLYLSYSLSTPFNSHNKQVLLNNVKYLGVINDNLHSDRLNRNKYSEKLDNLNKYGITITNDLNDLYTTYNQNEFNSYDNSYKKFNVDQNKVSLSYSKMNTYYECAFAYYLRYILKINEINDAFMIDIGHIVHETLQKMLRDKTLDFDDTWQRAINHYEVIFDSEKDIFFMLKIKEEIRQDLNIIIEQTSHSVFNEADYEKEIIVDLNDKIDFKGIVDKILKYKNNLCIVDYKTGSTQIDSKLFEYGLSLQLPSYLFLIKNSKKYSDSNVVGYYLQHLILDDYKYSDKKSKDEIKNESMKLDGYTNSNEDLIDLLDMGLKEKGASDLVSGLKKKQDGTFTVNALNKLKNDQEMIDLSLLVEDKIVEAGNNILNNDFSINPKLFNGKDISCTYCDLKDICYRRNRDYVSYKKKEEE